MNPRVTHMTEPKSDEQYISQEPYSEAIAKLRAEIIGELMLKKKLGIEVEEDAQDV